MAVGFAVDIAGERLVAPDHIDADPQSLRSVLSVSTGDARLLLLCFGTSHASGYFREACVRELADADRNWVLPFVVATLGDRVSNVAFAALETLQAVDTASILDLARNNPALFTRTRSRATAHWGEHHRWGRCRRARDYPPIIMLAGIERQLRADRKNRARSAGKPRSVRNFC